MDKLGIGIIGGGSIAHVHARALAKSERGRVLGVAEPNPQARDSWKRAKVHLEPDYRALLTDKRIQVVDLCLPHDLHEPVALEAFAYGKHVITEKPIARSGMEADRMLAAAHVANRRLIVSHNQLFQPTLQEMKRLLLAGEIGRPFLGVIVTIGDELARMNDPGHWKGDSERAGGGVMIDTGMHAVYLLEYLLGPARAAMALGRRLLAQPPGKGEDNAVVALEFDGCLGSITVTYTATNHPWSESRQVHGPQGALYATEEPDSVLTLVRRGERRELMREPNSWLASITASLEDALRAIQTGEEPFVSEDSVRHAMATMDAIYLSLRQGRRVEVGQAE